MNLNSTLPILGLLFIVFAFSACHNDPNYDPHNTPLVRYIDYNHKIKSGKIIRYYDDGRPKSMGYHRWGKRDSLWITWHHNGNKELEMGYKKNRKHGLYKYYRKTGELYREIEYTNGRKDGMYREYWMNGKLKYELEYIKGYKNQGTLVEFQKDGKIKADQHLVITEKNTVKTDGNYAIYVYFSDKPKKSAYFVKVDGRGYFLEQEGNMGVLRFPVPKGIMVMKRVQFEGFYVGRKQTVKTVKRSFNIGVTNF